MVMAGFPGAILSSLALPALVVARLKHSRRGYNCWQFSNSTGSTGCAAHVRLHLLLFLYSRVPLEMQQFNSIMSLACCDRNTRVLSTSQTVPAEADLMTSQCLPITGRVTVIVNLECAKAGLQLACQRLNLYQAMFAGAAMWALQYLAVL